MDVTILNPEGIDYDDFALWLCIYLKDNGFSILSRNLALEKLWDDFFQENDWGWKRDSNNKPMPPSVNYILNAYFDNLTVRPDGSNYVITCRDEATIRGTSIKIVTLADAINYGTLSMEHPYPYIENLFDIVADSLTDLYEIYLENGGEEVKNNDDAFEIEYPDEEDEKE